MNLIAFAMHVLSIIFLTGIAGSLIVLLTVGIGMLNDLEELFGDD